MKRVLVLMLLAFSSLALAIGAYLAIYWVAGWAAFSIGYETRLGHFIGIVGGLLAPMNFGVVAILLLAFLFFYLLSRKWGRRPSSA
jgi:uncharacterized membrane protein